MNSLKEIEHAIDRLDSQQLAELYTWLDRHRPALQGAAGMRIFEQGLGLFGSPEEAALLDEVVELAYNDRRRPAKPSPSL